jgi:hypothetical protein
LNELLDISHRVSPVTVIGSGVVSPVEAFTDGQHFYFDDATVARVGAHLTGLVDLAGRPVRIERTEQGWHEQRGQHIRQLHQRHVRGRVVYRFDDEWLFTVVSPS